MYLLEIFRVRVSALNKTTLLSQDLKVFSFENPKKLVLFALGEMIVLFCSKY